MTNNVGERLVAIETKVETISEDIKEIKQYIREMDERYITRQEHNYLKGVVYSAIGFLGTLFIVAITWVINKLGGI